MQAQTWFETFGSSITTEFSIPAEHCQPTLDFGNSCGTLGSPYISRCNYDGAGIALAAVLGQQLRPRGSFVQLNLKTINQAKYFSDVPGLADKAFLYVPSSCQNGARCGIHIAFHGCNQNVGSIGNVYAVNVRIGFLCFVISLYLVIGWLCRMG
jgi:hypothetical protein